MFSSIINAIIWLVILGLVWYLISWLPLPAPIGTIVTVLFVLLAIVVILSLFGVISIGVPRVYK